MCVPLSYSSLFRQTTGGNYTDWREGVSGWLNVGFPIAHCRPDGSATIAKNPGTGGLVNCKSVTEQLLYEIGDPQSYVLPDVIVDFTTVTVAQEGPDRVAIAGASGRPPTPTHKVPRSRAGFACLFCSSQVCVTRPSGFLLSALLLVPGAECRAKAAAVAKAILANGNAGIARLGLAPITEFHYDVIGGGGECGCTANGKCGNPANCGSGYNECVLRMVFAHPEQRALSVAGLEVAPAALATAPGLCGVGTTGRAAPSRRMRQFSRLLPKAALRGAHRFAIGGDAPVAIDDAQFSAPFVAPPRVASVGKPIAAGGTRRVVPLWRAAFGRSGDKGDSANIGIVARSEVFFAELRAQLTEEAVRRHLESLGLRPRRVERFELPRLLAFNFLVHEVLGGGGGSSLLLDKQGKTFAQKLLAMPVSVSVPASL